jgi:hypothetical protein
MLRQPCCATRLQARPPPDVRRHDQDRLICFLSPVLGRWAERLPVVRQYNASLAEGGRYPASAASASAFEEEPKPCPRLISPEAVMSGDARRVQRLELTFKYSDELSENEDPRPRPLEWCMRNHLAICSYLSWNCLNCQFRITCNILFFFRGLAAGGEYLSTHVAA